MKKQSNTFVATALSNKELENITREIKETVAFGLVERHHAIFTAAELWNIQRQGRVRVQRRYI